MAKDDERRTPTNAALDPVFTGAIGARVFKSHRAQLPDDLAPEVLVAIITGKDVPLPPELQKRLEPREETLLSVTARSDLAELRRCLDVGASGFHCMCVGGPVIEVSGPEGVRARITLHHGQSIRWDAAWSSDALLADGGRLVRWLAAHGVRGPLDEVEARSRRAAGPTGKAEELRDEPARAELTRRRGEALGRAFAAESNDFETRGIGAFGERGRRRVSVFAERDGRFWLIYYEDGAKKGDLRVPTTAEAVAAARKWLEV